MTALVDPSAIADRFREEIRRDVVAAPPLRVRGILTGEHGPSVTYAEYMRRACDQLGVVFETEVRSRVDVEDAVRAANADPSIDGIMVYYPVMGGGYDDHLRDVVAVHKDIEGLHSSWTEALYANRRTLDDGRTKAIVPCTPLAIVKLLEATGVFADEGPPLAGRTVTVFNRSEVVGRPLAAMLAHDGARVHSFDVHGPLLFEPPAGRETHHRMLESTITRREALGDSDIVITGVPSAAFELVRADELRSDSVCLNFSTHRNYAEDVVGRVACFVPRVGPMTVVMAIRNAVRLRANAAAVRP